MTAKIPKHQSPHLNRLTQRCSGIVRCLCCLPTSVNEYPQLFQAKFVLLVLYFTTFSLNNIVYVGRAIAEAVSRWLPTAATRVQSRV
jgi:hypothetical protein